jgi:hypothetical protein
MAFTPIRTLSRKLYLQAHQLVQVASDPRHEILHRFRESERNTGALQICMALLAAHRVAQ